MPNWCYNSVVISADTEAELHEFIQFANQTHTSRYRDVFKDNEEVVNEYAKGVFWNFVTPPKEIRDEYFGEQPRYADKLPVSDPNWWAQVQEQRKSSNFWYDWNITNWGTKWDVELEPNQFDIDECNNGTYSFCWTFETAWSPALPVYLAMSERFPNLTFDYEITEEANFFVGKLVFKNGLVKEEFVNDPTHQDFFDLDIPCTYCGRAGYKYCEQEED